jgi:hypothetical protein
MEKQSYDICVATIIVGNDSNSVIRDLVYQYTASVGSGIGACEFELEITDPDNPLLLFDYKLAPYEYTQVRESQRLCFEYCRFPNNLTKLLTACRDHNGYRAVLDYRDENGPCLLLQQTTKFSLLKHLKLPLVPANDERIKAYVCKEAKRFKASYEAALEEIAELQQELRAAKNETRGKYNDLKAEYARMMEEHRAEIENMRSMYE